MRPRIRIVAPSSRERREIERAGLGSRYRISYEPDDAAFFGARLYSEKEEDERTFHLGSHLDRAVERLRREPVDGFVSALDHPGSALAAFYARALDLPGPDPEVVLRCQHKLEARKAQQRLVPEATPPFALLDPANAGIEDPPLPYPFFIKPVKGRFSACARAVRHEDDWRALRESERIGPLLPPRPFRTAFNALLDRVDGPWDGNADHLIAEGLLRGVQCTVDGYVHAGQARILGIVDSIMYPGTISFARFQTPSTLPPTVQERMSDVARRLMEGMGYDQGLFNIEMFYDPETEDVGIIEVNPRLASGFADLYEKVHGSNLFELAMELARGREPRFLPGDGPFACAAAFVERTFEDRRVERIPDAEDIAEVMRVFPEARVEIDARPGGLLSDSLQDTASFRVALLHLGGRDAADLETKYRACLDMLPFDLCSLESEPQDSQPPEQAPKPASARST